MKTTLNMKIWVRLTGAICLLLVIAWAGILVWQDYSNRQAALRQAQEFAASIHEMTMAGLTGMMITGTIGQREVFLDQIKQLTVVKDLEVHRGAAVIKQFGVGTRKALRADPVEEQVLKSGKPYTGVHRDVRGDYLRVVTPTLAARNYLVSDRKPSFLRARRHQLLCCHDCVVMTFIVLPTSLQPASTDYRGK
jgi:methyl-accepting chemotaxis protein